MVRFEKPGPEGFRRFACSRCGRWADRKTRHQKVCKACDHRGRKPDKNIFNMRIIE